MPQQKKNLLMCSCECEAAEYIFWPMLTNFLLTFFPIFADKFWGYFAGFGNVLEHQITQDHSTGCSNGFGFVTFDSEQTVEDVLTHGKFWNFLESR
jgi:hypothetical protein